MIKNLLLTGLILFKLLTAAQNFVTTYSFVNVSTTSGTMDPGSPAQVNGLTLGPFSYHGSATNPNASGRFSFTGWPVGALDSDDDYLNYTAVLSPTVYYEVSLKITAGYTLDLNSITFAVRRSGTGVRNYTVRSSRDNFNNNLAATTGTNTKLSVLPGDVFFWNYDSISTASDQRGSAILMTNQLKGIVDSVTFRFYAWNAEAIGGTFSIDNVSFSGLIKDSTALFTSILSGEIKETKNRAFLYPNPVAMNYLDFRGDFDFSCTEVFSEMGVKVNCAKNQIDSAHFKIDISELCNGLYFLREVCGDKRRSISFIVYSD